MLYGIERYVDQTHHHEVLGCAYYDRCGSGSMLCLLPQRKVTAAKGYFHLLPLQYKHHRLDHWDCYPM